MYLHAPPVLELALRAISCQCTVLQVVMSAYSNCAAPVTSCRTRRRKAMVVQQSVELCLQLVNIVLYLVPNARALALRCVWADKANNSMAIVRFACWFTVSACLGACCLDLLRSKFIDTHDVSANLTASADVLLDDHCDQQLCPLDWQRQHLERLCTHTIRSVPS